MSAAARSSAASRVDEAEEEEEDDDGADSQEEGGESHFYRAARGAQPDRMETSDDEKSEDVDACGLGSLGSGLGLWPPQKATLVVESSGHLKRQVGIWGKIQ